MEEFSLEEDCVDCGSDCIELGVQAPPLSSIE